MPIIWRKFSWGQDQKLEGPIGFHGGSIVAKGKPIASVADVIGSPERRGHSTLRFNMPKKAWCDVIFEDAGRADQFRVKFEQMSHKQRKVKSHCQKVLSKENTTLKCLDRSSPKNEGRPPLRENCNLTSPSEDDFRTPWPPSQLPYLLSTTPVKKARLGEQFRRAEATMLVNPLCSTAAKPAAQVVLADAARSLEPMACVGPSSPLKEIDDGMADTRVKASEGDRLQRLPCSLPAGPLQGLGHDGSHTHVEALEASPFQRMACFVPGGPLQDIDDAGSDPHVEALESSVVPRIPSIMPNSPGQAMARDDAETFAKALECDSCQSKQHIVPSGPLQMVDDDDANMNEDNLEETSLQSIPCVVPIAPMQGLDDDNANNLVKAVESLSLQMTPCITSSSQLRGVEHDHQDTHVEVLESTVVPRISCIVPSGPLQGVEDDDANASAPALESRALDSMPGTVPSGPLQEMHDDETETHADVLESGTLERMACIAQSGPLRMVGNDESHTDGESLESNVLHVKALESSSLVSPPRIVQSGQLREMDDDDSDIARREAEMLFASLGVGGFTSCGDSQKARPDPPDLHQLPKGFTIEASCSWDDERVQSLHRKFASQDDRIGLFRSAPTSNFDFSLLLHGEQAVGYLYWRRGPPVLAPLDDQLKSLPQIIYAFIDDAADYRHNKTLCLGQRLLTWWSSRHSLQVFDVVGPNRRMRRALENNGCWRKDQRIEPVAGVAVETFSKSSNA